MNGPWVSGRRVDLHGLQGGEQRCESTRDDGRPKSGAFHRRRTSILFMRLENTEGAYFIQELGDTGCETDLLDGEVCEEVFSLAVAHFGRVKVVLVKEGRADRCSAPACCARPARSPCVSGRAARA